MGLRKAETALTQNSPIKGELPVTRTPENKNENGTAAAVNRLKGKTASTDTTAKASAQYKPRDFDAEARGKTRCVQFEAALMSPAIAGLPFRNLDEYLALVKKAAEAGVAYTFGE